MSTFAARLDVVAGNAAGMSILVEDELLIGRHADGAGQLADDQEISRSHARVTLDASGICTIEDLGSTNGTFVNGLRISAQQELSEGDKIDLGATTLVVGGLPTPALQETVSATAPQTTIPRERRRLPRLTQPRCRRNCPASTARHRCHQRYRCSWRLTSLPARRAFISMMPPSRCGWCSTPEHGAPPPRSRVKNVSDRSEPAGPRPGELRARELVAERARTGPRWTRRRVRSRRPRDG